MADFKDDEMELPPPVFRKRHFWVRLSEEDIFYLEKGLMKYYDECSEDEARRNNIQQMKRAYDKITRASFFRPWWKFW